MLSYDVSFCTEASLNKRIAFDMICGDACRSIVEVNKRIFFEEAYDREAQRNQREHSERKLLQQDLAREMKRAGSALTSDMSWDEARQALLDNGYTTLRQLGAADAERVRRCSLSYPCVARDTTLRQLGAADAERVRRCSLPYPCVVRDTTLRHLRAPDAARLSPIP